MIGLITKDSTNNKALPSSMKTITQLNIRQLEKQMAYTSIIFKNPHTGAMKEAPVGFSWTTLLFGFFPALFRGDWKYTAIQLVLAMLTMGFSGVIFAFIYNKLYIRDLIGAGFKGQSIASGDMNFASAKIGMQIPMLETA